MPTYRTQGCGNQTSTAARRYCDECREIRKAPNVERPGGGEAIFIASR
jgi:hypothetical protein